MYTPCILSESVSILCRISLCFRSVYDLILRVHRHMTVYRYLAWFVACLTIHLPHFWSRLLTFPLCGAITHLMPDTSSNAIYLFDLGLFPHYARISLIYNGVFSILLLFVLLAPELLYLSLPLYPL